MKINDIVNENVDLSVQRKIIETECSEYLNEVGTTKKLYRGLRSYSPVLEVSSPTDRRPRDTSVIWFDILNYAFAEANLPTRSNSLFTTGDYQLASDFSHEGSIYVVYPKNGFKFSWSKEVKDLTDFTVDEVISLQDFRNSIDWDGLYKESNSIDQKKIDVARGKFSDSFSAFSYIGKMLSYIPNRNKFIDFDMATDGIAEMYNTTDLTSAIRSGNEILMRGDFILVRKDIDDNLWSSVVTEEELSEGPNDKHIFKAIFTAGGPGSGKTTVARKLLSGYGFKEVNIDKLVEFIAKNKNLNLRDMNTWDDADFDRAFDLSEKQFALYLAGRLPMVIDGTGRNYTKITTLATQLKTYGYDVGLIFVNTDLETAKKRNLSRNRVVDDEYLENAWHNAQSNIGIYQDFFDPNMFIVDNSDSGNNVQNAAKRIDRFVSKPVTNHIAAKWLNQFSNE